MSFALDGQRLHREMTRRGLSSSDLARAAGVSPQTIAAAVDGRHIAAASVRSIAQALTSTPVDPVVDMLLGPVRGAAGVD